MKIVVDPGCLSRPQHSEKVKRFLAESLSNSVILTDFALGEACNGATVAGLKRTFSIFQNHLAQVSVLKITPIIAKMPPSAEGVHERFVDEVESNRVRAFLHRLFTGASTIDLEVSVRAKFAQQVFESLLQASDMIRMDMQAQLSRFSSQQLSHLRKNHLTRETAKELVDCVRDLAQQLFLEYADFKELPPAKDAIYSFPLRFALAICISVLYWGMEGGVRTAASKRLRNDVTDMTYVAYASFYDGLATADKRMARVHQRTRQLLPELFGARLS